MVINRRDFIGLSAIGLFGGLALKGCQGFVSQGSVSDGAAIAAIHRSKDGLLEIDLTAQYADLVLAEQAMSQMMTYNGQLPAPRLEVKPGDRLIIHFTNNLNQGTNLHFHGLHLSPAQDNVFLHIKPGETYTYELDIHPNQRGGTYWYHPHVHGSVAEQLFRGLAGIIVVRGELDNIPEIAAAQEEFFLLQDFALPNENSSHMNLMAGREGSLRLVNGNYHPTIEVTENLLRLRLVNASPSRFYNLQIKGQTLIQIATDGGALAQPKAIDQLLLTPGQRAELLIPTVNLPDIPIHLLNLPYQRTQMGMMGHQATQVVEAIADFKRAAKNYSTVTLPEAFQPIKPLPEPEQTRQFRLNHGMARGHRGGNGHRGGQMPGQGMAFLINGESYSGAVDTEVTLDTVEDWEIINTGTMDHPFHVHTNKFQIISRNGIPEAAIAWHDTVLVKVGETVKIRMAFQHFTGETVYHCHILDHEDLGMMGKLKISAPQNS
ncbi:multicopper oxidase family protein [[Limnothrix rosea] IAM M-220]|uniref:multicopper oxidase family protein n=1 Tax=[Limnothrix rosea] IAM M-220 TaxID=454133 RepID=UPI000969FE65|nr:multicopper oxidase family protein [[Limnothrix rosea] IAM M-220]OKH18574.1 copper oxidase [[Limnothrix rosea] IAM M-220]